MCGCKNSLTEFPEFLIRSEAQLGFSDFILFFDQVLQEGTFQIDN